ncbi:hypothetical protein M426DRAFT_319326 [Hypoxylon sp. CI-4A]|nr:hypothetical protein M426DRAFT_319326 [Hypoxylon sp. CI-4A]
MQFIPNLNNLQSSSRNRLYHHPRYHCTSGEYETDIMHRTLYVLVYPSRLFAAHWSFWLPYPTSSDSEPSHIGDRIHVTGDRLNGFVYEYIRDYNVSEDDRHPNAFPIGSILVTDLSEASNDGKALSGEGVGSAVLNAFDKACREVPAPGPSLNKVNSGTAGGAPPKRAKVKDCQWWIKEAVSHLVERGMLLPLVENDEGEIPASRVSNLPRH